MTETTATPAAAPTSSPGLLPRLVAVIFSPYRAYAAVAARPRALDALVVALVVMVTCQSLFLSTDIGKRALLDRQVRSMEAFGVTVTDEMYGQLQARLASAPFTAAAWQIVFLPVMVGVVAGLLLGVFNALLGGNATFKHVYAIVAHSAIVIALQQVFATPISYARGEFASVTDLSLFVPMLEDEHPVRMLLGSIDLFVIWWVISLAIGLGVLYKRQTGPVATGLLATYVGLALIITGIRTAF